MEHIFVIAGHGAGDPGACANGQQEAERVRALANRIKQFGGDSVTLGDFSRDYYADNGISTLNIPKDWQIIELHMDSASAGARGGHVIINAKYKADKYDNALAGFIGSILPGRSRIIVGRTDLANVRRAAAKGYGYRLVEFGFISNATDLQIFKTRMDDIAKGVLSAFEIGASTNPAPIPPTPSTPTPEVIVDSWIKRLQDNCNRQGFSNQKVDGLKGPVTLSGCPVLKPGAQGNITKLVQERLKALGFDCGFIDGIFGVNTEAAVMAFQRARGLSVDGIVGAKTWSKLLGL